MLRGRPAGHSQQSLRCRPGPGCDLNTPVASIAVDAENVCRPASDPVVNHPLIERREESICFDVCGGLGKIGGCLHSSLATVYSQFVPSFLTVEYVTQKYPVFMLLQGLLGVSDAVVSSRRMTERTSNRRLCNAFSETSSSRPRNPVWPAGVQPANPA